MNDETPLESEVINAILAGNDPMLKVLRQQRSRAIVKKREYSGCGFFTHFRVDPDTPRVEPGNFVIGDVALDIEATENGASAMLFVKNGFVDFLEVVTHTGDWPANAILKKVHYFKRKSLGSFDELIAADERDIEVTRRSWAK